MPRGATNAEIGGGFSVEGVTNDTIVVMILSEKDYNSWRNGEDVKAYYESGNVTRSPLYTKLPSDESFYLILDNSMHRASSKIVESFALLSYY